MATESLDAWVRRRMRAQELAHHKEQRLAPTKTGERSERTMAPKRWEQRKREGSL